MKSDHLALLPAQARLWLPLRILIVNWNVDDELGWMIKF
jgi:hypothetical protein